MARIFKVEAANPSVEQNCNDEPAWVDVDVWVTVGRRTHHGGVSLVKTHEGLGVGAVEDPSFTFSQELVSLARRNATTHAGQRRFLYEIAEAALECVPDEMAEQVMAS